MSGFHAQDPLELQAVSAKEGSAPHGVTSRRHLEMALEKMGPEFGCVGSRNAGKGKAFAHSVAVAFPQFFKLQEEGVKF